ncbi:28810_t:CDS:1, partial [Gigaspora margarita]
MNQLVYSFKNLTDLADNTSAVNVLMSISPIYNRIVIDLSHTDDNENNAFINGALSFGPIISMNYSSNDNSLPLKSTSNSLSSRPFTKRQLYLFFNGGEDVVINNNGPEIIYSAGFSLINTRNTTNQYLLTSARCIPDAQNPLEIFYSPWHPPFSEQLAFYYFGRVFLTQRVGVDFALIEKLEETFKLSLMVRTSIQDYPIVPIGSVDLDTNLPVGHHICKSGYGTQSWCRKINTIDSRLSLRREGGGRIEYTGIIKAHINVLANDIGGTIFYFRIIDDIYIELVGYGICTYIYSNLDLGIAITPLRNIKNYRTTKRMFDVLEFINSNNTG